MEPIAHGVARRGHRVHVVAPWHPLITRPAIEGGVHFHFYRYAPHRSINVFGYAGALREDVALRWSAWIAAPLALAAGLRAARHVARRAGATIMHGHWVLPGGVTASMAAPELPLVVSLHGSDVYVAERHAALRRFAKLVFRRAEWVTACSDDLRTRAIALGAAPQTTEVIPYGVDPQRFRPSREAPESVRRAFGLDSRMPLVVAVGRLVRKKGFDYLIDAMAALRSVPLDARLIVVGGGDLDGELRARAVRAGVADRVLFAGTVHHDRVADFLAAADIVAVPSIRDEAGNVDGLPNVVMEALASATPVVATPAGGIAAVIRDGETGVLVPERNAAALAAAIQGLLEAPERRVQIGQTARRDVQSRFGWDSVAQRLETAYDFAVRARVTN
jgi:glycosyltransferase involved in cell wall biosynthesis